MPDKIQDLRLNSQNSLKSLNVYYGSLTGRPQAVVQKQRQKYFTTEAQRAQSFTLLTAPTAQLTIKRFSLCSLCLCGEPLLKFLNA